MQQLKKFLTRKRQDAWKGMSKLVLSPKKHQSEKASAEEDRRQAMERLGKNPKKNRGFRRRKTQ